MKNIYFGLKSAIADKESSLSHYEKY